MYLNVIDPVDWVQYQIYDSIVPAGLRANEKSLIHDDLIYTRDEVIMGDQSSKNGSRV